MRFRLGTGLITGLCGLLILAFFVLLRQQHALDSAHRDGARRDAEIARLAKLVTALGGTPFPAPTRTVIVVRPTAWVTVTQRPGITPTTRTPRPVPTPSRTPSRSPRPAPSPTRTPTPSPTRPCLIPPLVCP